MGVVDEFGDVWRVCGAESLGSTSTAERIAVTCYGSLFWAYNTPGCFLWARVLPNGRVYVQKDYKFVRKPIETVAEEIEKRTLDLAIDRLAAVYADPEIFPKASPSKTTIEAETPSQVFGRCGLGLIPAGTNREHGWQRIHDYLRDAPDGKPWLIISPECSALARTLPSLVQDDKNPDDCVGDDYAANALRFLLSARPSPRQIATAKPVYAFGTVGWLKQQDAKDKAQRGLLSR